MDDDNADDGPIMMMLMMGLGMALMMIL